jgi:hypothetical protein
MGFFSPPGERVRVCGRMTGARVREFKGVHVCEHAGAEAMVAGQDDGSVTVSANRQGVDQEREARVALYAVALAKDCIPAWHDGQHHTARRRSDAAATRQDILG